MKLQKVEDLPALTGLRFGAALMIVIHHLSGILGVPDYWPKVFPLDNGVSFFFVLSGFILTHVYGEEMDKSRRRRFYLARFARIWPTHMACILLLCMFVSAPRLNSAEAWATLLANLTLLQAWVPDYSVFFSLNAVSWTISVEAVFYCLFPYIAYQPRSRFLLWLAGAFACIVAMAVVTWVIGAEPFQRRVFAPSIDGMMYINPVSRLFEFILGIATARIWFHRQSWLNEGKWKASVMQVLAISLAIVAFTQAIGIATWAKAPLGPPFAMWLEKGGVTCLASAFLIFAMAARHGVPYRLFASGPMVYLGKISFALYLFHQLPIRYYSRHTEYFAQWNDSLAILAYAISVIGVASLLHHLVEEPCRRWLMAKGDAKPRQAAAKPL